jgi:transcriptional regulator of acetoin/glycerol metabolism
MADSSGWETFVESNSFNKVRLPIAASWQRSHACGVPTAHGTEMVRSRVESDPDDPLTRAARTVLHASEDALSGTTTWVAVADPRGVVTYEWSSTADLRRRLERVDVTAGIHLDERTVGTNGIGLALATRTDAVVRGAEHFNPSWRSLVCTASPLLHPITGDVLGVVNVTSQVGEHNEYLRVVLGSMVAGIREVLAAGLRTHHQRLLDAHFAMEAVSPGNIVTLDAHTMILEDPNRVRGLGRAQLWNLVERAGLSATEVSIGSGLRARVVFVDPLDIAAGCSLVIPREAPVPDRRGNQDAASLGPIERAEYEVIRGVLREVEGNKSEAAHRLRISRGTLYERLRRYGITDAG